MKNSKTLLKLTSITLASATLLNSSFASAATDVKPQKSSIIPKVLTGILGLSAATGLAGGLIYKSIDAKKKDERLEKLEAQRKDLDAKLKSSEKQRQELEVALKTTNARLKKLEAMHQRLENDCKQPAEKAIESQDLQETYHALYMRHEELLRNFNMLMSYYYHPAKMKKLEDICKKFLSDPRFSIRGKISFAHLKFLRNVSVITEKDEAFFLRKIYETISKYYFDSESLVSKLNLQNPPKSAEEGNEFIYNLFYHIATVMYDLYFYISHSVEYQDEDYIRNILEYWGDPNKFLAHISNIKNKNEYMALLQSHPGTLPRPIT